MRCGGDEVREERLGWPNTELLAGTLDRSKLHTSPALTQSLRDSFYSDGYPHSTLLVVGPLTSVAYVFAADMHTTQEQPWCNLVSVKKNRIFYETVHFTN